MTIRWHRHRGVRVALAAALTGSAVLALVGLGVGSGSAQGAYPYPYPTTITIVHRVIPPTDPGRWDVFIDSTRYLTQVGDNASTGPIEVAAGSHVIRVAGRQLFTLRNYSTQILCSDKTSTTRTSLDVQLTSGESLTCTITERRRLRRA
jgi:hypothetical protein